VDFLAAMRTSAKHGATVPVEPFLCLLLGVVLSPFDPFLGVWFKASGLALFIKEQLTHSNANRRIWIRQMPRIEAQRLNAGLNQYVSRANQGAQRAPPRQAARSATVAKRVR